MKFLEFSTYIKKDRCDKKTRVLPELEPVDRDWVKAPSDPEAERVA